MTTFEVVPRGPFDLASAQDFAGGFTPGIGGGGVTGTSIVMAFPVEASGWSASAAVEVHQPFSAEAMLLRGCGILDAIPTTEDASREAIASLYGVDTTDQSAVDGITERWRPYRMWATVLVRMGWSRPGRQGELSPKGLSADPHGSALRRRPTTVRAAARRRCRMGSTR
jgi:hypothetical protein